MTVDSYVNMSVDDLTTELNTLQTKRSKPKLQLLIGELIAYKSENRNIDGSTILQQLQQQTTLSRQPARLTNLPDGLRNAYRDARQSGGKRKTKKSRKSKKYRKTKRRR